MHQVLSSRLDFALLSIYPGLPCWPTLARPGLPWSALVCQRPTPGLSVSCILDTADAVAWTPTGGRPVRAQGTNRLHHMYMYVLISLTFVHSSDLSEPIVLVRALIHLTLAVAFAVTFYLNLTLAGPLWSTLHRRMRQEQRALTF